MRGPSAYPFRYRALSPEQMGQVLRELESGTRADALAARYGVHRRTIYRARAYAAERRVRVVVGDWWAWHVIGELGPVRTTAWFPVSDEGMA